MENRLYSVIEAMATKFGSIPKITTSTEEPTGGQNGDIWLIYGDDAEETSSLSGQGFVVQDTAPSNTRVLWIDSANSNIIKFFNGSGWVPCGSTWTE